MRQDKDSASKGKYSETYGERVSEHIALHVHVHHNSGKTQILLANIIVSSYM